MTDRERLGYAVHKALESLFDTMGTLEERTGEQCKIGAIRITHHAPRSSSSGDRATQAYAEAKLTLTARGYGRACDNA